MAKDKEEIKEEIKNPFDGFVTIAESERLQKEGSKVIEIKVKPDGEVVHKLIKGA